MADGVYEVGPSVEGSQFPAQRMAVGAGYTGYWPGQYMGSWVMYIEEGEFVKGGPAASGTVTVTRDGDDYTFAVDLADDFGYKITGTFTVTFDNVKQMTISYGNVVWARRIPPGFLHAAASRRRMVGRVGHPSGSSERLRSGPRCRNAPLDAAGRCAVFARPFGTGKEMAVSVSRDTAAGNRMDTAVQKQVMSDIR